MADYYRAYEIGKDGNVKRSRGFVCNDGADATVWARQLIDGNNIELWSGERFVTRIAQTRASETVP